MSAYELAGIGFLIVFSFSVVIGLILVCDKEEPALELGNLVFIVLVALFAYGIRSELTQC